MIEAPPAAAAFDAQTLWRRLMSFRGEMAWVAVGQTLAAVGGIVGVKLLTRFMPPTAYGQLALGLTFATLIQQSVLSPFTGASLRFFSAARDARELGSFLEALNRVLRAAVLVILALFAIGTAAAVVLHERVWIPIMGWCTVFALFTSFSYALDGMQNAARQRIIVAWHDGLGIWLRFLLGTAVVIILGARASNALAGYALAALLVLGSQYFFFNRGILAHKTDALAPKKIEKWRRAIVDYGWPFATWGIFVWAQSASERWALQIFSDTTHVGQYAVLFQLGYYPITMVNGVIIQLVSPVLYSMAGDGTDDQRLANCRRLAILLSICSLACTGLVFVLAKFFGEKAFSLIVAPAYLPAASMLPWMMLSAGIFWSGQYGGLLLMSQTSTKSLVAPKIGTAFLAVSLNMLGARSYGLRGVVFASCIFSAAHYFWTMGLVLSRAGRIPRLAPGAA